MEEDRLPLEDEEAPRSYKDEAEKPLAAEKTVAVEEILCLEFQVQREEQPRRH